MAGKFIKKAIKRPGALTRKADEAGVGIASFARKHAGSGGLTGDQSRFYLNVLMPAARRRRGMSKGS